MPLFSPKITYLKRLSFFAYCSSTRSQLCPAGLPSATQTSQFAYVCSAIESSISRRNRSGVLNAGITIENLTGASNTFFLCSSSSSAVGFVSEYHSP